MFTILLFVDDTGRQTKHTDDQDEENEEKGSENEEVETIGLHHQPVSGNVDKSRDPNRWACVHDCQSV